MKKILSILITICFIAISCKKEAKKEDGKQAVLELTSFSISGMKCKNNCVTLIQKELKEKAGVISAEVNFKNSLANIQFDANKTNKKDLMAFVSQIKKGEDAYKAVDLPVTKACCGTKKPCSSGSKSPCKTSDKQVSNSDSKKSCNANCKKECCNSDSEKSCSANCKKECCNS